MMSEMRTTITLDAEADALVQKAMRERQLSFKRGRQRSHHSGPCSSASSGSIYQAIATGPALMNLDKASQIAGELEDEEIMRKMSQGK